MYVQKKKIKFYLEVIDLKRIKKLNDIGRYYYFCDPLNQKLYI